MSRVLHRVLAGAAARLLGAAGPGRLSIMIFHQVLEAPAPYPYGDPDAA